MRVINKIDTKHLESIRIYKDGTTDLCRERHDRISKKLVHWSDVGPTIHVDIHEGTSPDWMKFNYINLSCYLVKLIKYVIHIEVYLGNLVADTPLGNRGLVQANVYIYLSDGSTIQQSVVYDYHSHEWIHGQHLVLVE